MRLITVLILMFCLVIPVHAQEDVFRPTPPDHTEVITPENADRLEPLGILGRGVIRGMDWSPDSAILAVKTTIGVWIYAEGREEPFLIEGDIESVTVDEAWTTLAIKHGGQIDVWDIRQLERQEVTVDLEGMSLSRFPLFLSPDGTTLTFLINREFEADVQVWRWDVEQNELRDTQPIGSDYINDVSISPRGEALMIARGLGSEIITMFDALERFPLRNGGGATAFHPTRPLAAVRERRDRAHSIRIFDYTTGSDVATLAYPHFSVQLLFTPSGDRLLIRDLNSRTGNLWSWDFATGEVKVGTGGRVIYPHDLLYVSFTPNERYVVFEENNRYQRWNLETMRAEPSKHGGQSPRFSDDGSLTALSDSDGISVFQVGGDTPIAQFAAVHSPVFSPDGERIVATQRGGRRAISIIELDGGEVIGSGGYGEYASPGFSPQGDLIIQWGAETSLWRAPFTEPIRLSTERIRFDEILSADQAMNVFSYEIDFDRLRQWTISEVEGQFAAAEAEPRTFEIFTEPQDRVMRFTISPDARLFVASGGEDPYFEWSLPYLYVRDLETGRYQYLYDHSGQINFIAFSPNGRGFASGSGFITEYYESDDTTLRLWDVQVINGTRQLVERARFYYDDPVYEVGYSPNSRLIAARTRSKLSVRDTVSGREVFNLDDWRVSGFAFSPDSRLLAVQVDGVLQMWDVETGEMLSRQPLAAAADIFFDPDGRWIATTATDGVVRLWGVP